MTNKLSKTIRLVYGILLSSSIVLAGLCLMAACLGIYDGGAGEFSREAVADAFSPIAGPVYLCLILAVLGFPVGWLTRTEQKKSPAGKREDLILKRLHEKTDLSACAPELQAAVAREQDLRRDDRYITGELLLLSILVFIIYILTGDRFLLSDITSSMKKAMLVLAPFLALTFGYALWAHYRSKASVSRETELMKQANAQAPIQPEKKAQVEAKENLGQLQAAIVLVALALLLFGYFTGGSVDVLTKAVNICTECVGLG